MKTYTVREIAQMLSANEETVRRWIRDGKLEATCTSRKAGNLVTEESLQAFLKARQSRHANYVLTAEQYIQQLQEDYPRTPLTSRAELLEATGMSVPLPLAPAVSAAIAGLQTEVPPPLGETPVSADELGPMVEEQIQMLERKIAAAEETIAERQRQLEIDRTQLKIFEGMQNILNMKKDPKK